jgi:hypothetical protein
MFYALLASLAGQDPEPANDHEVGQAADAKRPQPPENEIYAINQTVGNQNAMIWHQLSTWCMNAPFN